MKIRHIAMVMGLAACSSDAPELAGFTATLPSAAGSDGYRPLAWVGCHSALDIVGSGRAELGLDYEVVLFSNRDASVTCAANFHDHEGGSTNYRPSTLTAASTALCIAVCDLPPVPPSGESGYWTFKIGKEGPYAAYADSDPGHPLNGRIYVFPEADCSVMKVGPGGEWQRGGFTAL